MTKAQVAALLAAATVGAGGSRVVDVMLKAAPRPYVHAVDLRRDIGPTDAGIKITAYATQSRSDARQLDIGMATVCKPTAATQKNATQVMDALARECEWP